jgi:hypothetical protein
MRTAAARQEIRDGAACRRIAIAVKAGSLFFVFGDVLIGTCLKKIR